MVRSVGDIAEQALAAWLALRAADPEVAEDLADRIANYYEPPDPGDARALAVEWQALRARLDGVAAGDEAEETAEQERELLALAREAAL